ncbi:mitochondrial serine hydrolase (FSH1) [Andalucia godoyi]|uniref:Mitochondrial serine hydrolase (FSH1) n=1 Tax=Andalucia godoyi TaxID=505711 RepID=A0A8K0F2V5_ANDGO|nr:mitochondrial serine hydrolase (FSH1) [Andalucia godoyi]|eukprot:ANDGO_01006.mRNA.1 mitochondrial serine hydrolase (FSH1)
MSSPARKLRILCFHGFRQNASGFRGRLGALRKYLKSYADLEFLEAPHDMQETVVDETTGEVKAVNRRTWWKFEEVEIANPEATHGADQPATIRTYVYHGVEDAVQAVQAYNLSAGPFDGILGFSQGAAFASYLVATNALPASVKFMILVSGFVPRAQAVSHLYPATNQSVDVSPFSIPTLHVVGETDDLIPPKESQKLVDCFADAILVKHSGGHYVPTTAGCVNAYRNLCARFMENPPALVEPDQPQMDSSL